MMQELCGWISQVIIAVGLTFWFISFVYFVTLFFEGIRSNDND